MEEIDVLKINDDDDDDDDDDNRTISVRCLKKTVEEPS